MPPDPHTLERTAELKRELLEFARSRRYRREFEQELDEHVGPSREPGQTKLIYFMDHLLLQHNFSDGRTLVESYVQKHPNLPEQERQMLLGWRDVREGIFRVDENSGDSLTLFNLVDDLTYRAYSNMGEPFYGTIETGMFLMARLVPLGDAWLFSGGQCPFSRRDRDQAYATAVQMANTMPRVVFQNPERLRQAWELQQKEHQSFVEFIGTDLLVLPGKDVARRLDDYMRWRMTEQRDETGKTVAELTLEETGKPLDLSNLLMPNQFENMGNVGVIYDDVDGMNFFPNFDLVAESFSDPTLVDDPEHAEAVVAYLQSPDIIPLPLKRLAERDPDNASRVFQALLEEPRFSWKRDGDRLLRDYKPDYYAKPPLPGITPMSETLTEARQVTTSGKSPGRNAPCPCGSGKEYKHCHGRQARKRGM